MSVGGIVVGLERTERGICVSTAERLWWKQPPKLDLHNVTAVVVERGERIRLGDSLWWQGPYAFWTPQRNRERPEWSMRQGVDFDVKLRRLGPSHGGRANPGYVMEWTS